MSVAADYVRKDIVQQVVRTQALESEYSSLHYSWAPCSRKKRDRERGRVATSSTRRPLLIILIILPLDDTKCCVVLCCVVSVCAVVHLGKYSSLSS